MKDRPECLANVSKQGFTAPFGHEYYMIIAIPRRMGQALIGFGHGVLLGSAHQATRGELYSRNAQSCSSHTGQTSGLPQILSYEQALQVAELADVKRLAITHHDPDHDDVFLRRMEQLCQERFPHCVLARDGMEIEL